MTYLQWILFEEFVIDIRESILGYRIYNFKVFRKEDVKKGENLLKGRALLIYRVIVPVWRLNVAGILFALLFSFLTGLPTT